MRPAAPAALRRSSLRECFSQRCRDACEYARPRAGSPCHDRALLIARRRRGTIVSATTVSATTVPAAPTIVAIARWTRRTVVLDERPELLARERPIAILVRAIEELIRTRSARRSALAVVSTLTLTTLTLTTLSLPALPLPLPTLSLTLALSLLLAPTLPATTLLTLLRRRTPARRTLLLLLLRHRRPRHHRTDRRQTRQFHQFTAHTKTPVSPPSLMSVASARLV